MNSSFSRKRTKLGVVYGLIAGIFFTLAAWGMDAIILSRHNVALPFLKFLPAFLICVPAAILAGYLTAKIENGIVTILLWAGLAFLFTFLVLNLPLKFAPWYLGKLRSDLGPVIHFKELIGIGGYWFYCSFAIGITCVLCGFLQNLLVDQALGSSSQLGPRMPFIVCASIMLLCGLFGDLLYTRDFRNPVVAFDDLLKNASFYYNQEVDDLVNRELRLRTVEPLGELVLQPYKLTLVEVDSYLTLTKVLIEFENQDALCQAIQGQPSFCKVINIEQQGKDIFYDSQEKNTWVDVFIDDIIEFTYFSAPGPT